MKNYFLLILIIFLGPISFSQIRFSNLDVFEIQYAKDPYETLLDADALLIMTEWSEFRHPNFSILEKLLLKKLIFDGRNIFNPADMQEYGYEYYSIGRNKVG